MVRAALPQDVAAEAKSPGKSKFHIDEVYANLPKAVDVVPPPPPIVMSSNYPRSLSNLLNPAPPSRSRSLPPTPSMTPQISDSPIDRSNDTTHTGLEPPASVKDTVEAEKVSGHQHPPEALTQTRSSPAPHTSLNEAGWMVNEPTANPPAPQRDTTPPVDDYRVPAEVTDGASHNIDTGTESMQIDAVNISPGHIPPSDGLALLPPPPDSELDIMDVEKPQIPDVDPDVQMLAQSFNDRAENLTNFYENLWRRAIFSVITIQSNTCPQGYCCIACGVGIKEA